MRERWRYLPRLLALLWDVGARDVVTILCFALLLGLAPPLIVVSLQRLVDAAVAVLQQRATIQQALLWALALFAANILHQLLGATNRWLGELTQERLKLRVQERVLQKAGRLALAEFERPATYDRLHRAQLGLDTRLFSTIQQLIPLPASLVTALALLLYLGQGHILLPPLLLLGVVPLALWSTRFLTSRYLLDRQQTHPERVIDYLTRVMTERPAAAEIRLFGLQQHLLAAWGRAYRPLCRERLRLDTVESGAMLLRTVIERLVYGAGMVVVVALIIAGRISLGAFAGYHSAMEHFTAAIYDLLWNIALTDRDLRYIRDLLEYLDLPEETSGTQRLAPASAAPTIQFESVSYRYPGADRNVLDQLSFTLRPGERIALVGENGAGKTTLAKLLLGLYRPTSGRIRIDGVDMAELDQTWWRTQGVAVFQDYVRYAVTARENIGFGDLAQLADDLALHIAAQRSGADSVVAALPQGYATMLGKVFDAAGSDLSGGQWQTFAIARAYLRDAAVLVLDEPTAALDARAEVEVYRQFRDVAQGRSVLLISHRLGAARLADRILVLAGGQITETGTHAELLASGGHYAMLYHTQAAWYQVTTDHRPPTAEDRGWKLEDRQHISA